MPGDGFPGGHLTRTELGELAEWFDRFHFAFDPTDSDALRAQAEFDRRLRELYETRVRPLHPQTRFAVFLGRVRANCWEYLKKNKP